MNKNSNKVSYNTLADNTQCFFFFFTKDQHQFDLLGDFYTPQAQLCTYMISNRAAAVKNHVFQQVFVYLGDCIYVVSSPLYFTSRLRQLLGNTTAAATTCRKTCIMQL